VESSQRAKITDTLGIFYPILFADMPRARVRAEWSEAEIVQV